jgi:hypothetical protein
MQRSGIDSPPKFTIYPSNNQASYRSYQGAVQAPTVCGAGSPMYDASQDGGALFSAVTNVNRVPMRTSDSTSGIRMRRDRGKSIARIRLLTPATETRPLAALPGVTRLAVLPVARTVPIDVWRAPFARQLFLLCAARQHSEIVDS